MMKHVERVESGASAIAGAQSIGRVFSVLHLFRDRGTSLGVVAVAEELGLSLSTTHRLVRALVHEGYLLQDEETERYHLGLGALLLGRAAENLLGINAVRPALEGLSARTGESVNFGLLNGTEAVVALRVESPHPLRFSQRPGTRISLYASSMGKALLAFNPVLAEHFFDGLRKLDAITPNTHSSAKSLREDVDSIKARGWSIDDEESLVGVRCVAAPILSANGRAHAAIAVQAPAARMSNDRLMELGPEVVAVAKEISAILPVDLHALTRS